MKSKIICIIFALLIFGFSVLDILAPDREFSEWENRSLAQSPKLTFNTLASGEFGKAYEEYITDQFPLRDILVKAKFVSDSALGKKDSGGVYITESALYSVQPQPDMKIVDKNIMAIDNFSLTNDLSTFLLTVPSSTYIYSDLLPHFSPVVDEGEIFSHIENNLNSAEFINVENKIFENRESYIYFRTDHHWTSEGALIGYNSFLNALGKPLLNKDDFTINEISASFEGTLTSKSGAIGIEKDIIQRYDRKSEASVEIFNGVESTSYPSIYFDEYIDKKDKYSYYLGTNQPIVRVKTDSEGGKLLVFKDSYAHIMLPLMLGEWSEIVLVDLRYVRNPIGVLLKNVTGYDIGNFDTALFLYSTETFTTQDNMVWLK